MASRKTDALPQYKILWEPNPGPQTDFLRRREDVVLFGGAKGPGKTDGLIADACGQINKPGYKALLVRRTFPQIQEIIDRAHALFPRMGGKWNGDIRRYIFPNGSLVDFGSCDSEMDKERYQGHEYSWIGFDQLEQFSETQFNFICSQNRTTNPDIKCYIRATANPGSVGHWWIKRLFIDGKNPNETHSVEFPHPLEPGKKIVRTSSYVPARVYDNPALLRANPGYLANLMSLPETERRAYLEGDWSAFTTDCVFDKSGMTEQEKRIEEPAWRGRLTDRGDRVDFETDEKGEFLIWRQPEAGANYFVFADPAYGKTSGDYSPAGVFRHGTYELVALWYGRVDPASFGKHVYGIGMYYNWARVAVEVRPGPGIATVSKLVELEYPNLYKHYRWENGKHTETEEIGWVTDERTRQDMISAGKSAIREKNAIIRSRIMLDEMYNFIRTASGREEARSECYDDCVIVFCGAMRCMRFDPVSGYLDGPRENSPMIISGGVRLPRINRRRTGMARSGALAGYV